MRRTRHIGRREVRNMPGPAGFSAPTDDISPPSATTRSMSSNPVDFQILGRRTHVRRQSRTRLPRREWQQKERPMADKLDYRYQIYIAAPIGKVWKGLVDGEMTRHYVYGTRLEGVLKKGSSYAYVGDGDFKVVDGKILEVEPEKRLVMTWNAHWDDKVAKDRASRVTYHLSTVGPSTTKLGVVHDDFDDRTPTYVGSVEGWPLMLSSLKSLLETGKALETK